MSGTTTPATPVQVPGYPLQNLVTGAYTVVDATHANTATQNQVTLLIGQMLSSGTATANQPVLSSGIGAAQTAFGLGSQLAIMVERYRNLDNFGTLYCLPLADASGATAATATITFTGPATANGTLPLYVDGNYVPVGVTSSWTAAQVATATAAAINAWTSSGGNPLPWTAAVGTGETTNVVTLTAANKGALAMTGTVWLSYRGPANGEGQFGTTGIPGLTATLTPPAGGATNPYTSLQTALANLTAYGGTATERATFSTALNDQHLSAIGANQSPNPDWHWAVDYTAACAVSLKANPAVPVGGLGGGAQLNVLPPLLANQDSFSEQDTLLYDGISTYTVSQSGLVLVQRAITTYQKNAGGAPDNSYRNVNVPYQLMQWIRAWRSMILSQFNQAILVADGTRIPPGSQMVTPTTIETSTVALYNAFADAGLVQNAAQFAENVVFTNAGGGVVTCLLPVQLANQLIAVAADLQFTQP
jgi:phage tail sheath gpL-like